MLITGSLVGDGFYFNVSRVLSAVTKTTAAECLNWSCQPWKASYTILINQPQLPTAYLLTWALIYKLLWWDFPGGPVAKSVCSQCRGPEFNPWSGNSIQQLKIPHAAVKTRTAKINKTKNKQNYHACGPLQRNPKLDIPWDLLMTLSGWGQGEAIFSIFQASWVPPCSVGWNSETYISRSHKWESRPEAGLALPPPWPSF